MSRMLVLTMGLVAALATTPARAEVVEPVGSHLLVTALVGDQRLKLLTRTDFPAEANTSLWIRPEPDKLRWFDAKTGQEIANSAG